MANTRHLLNVLTAYKASIEKDQHRLRNDFDGLTTRWRVFRAVYDGDAAQEFHSGWAKTEARFKEYMDRLQKINKLLEKRITALEEANRTGGL